MNAALSKAQIEITYGEIDLAYHSEIEVFMGWAHSLMCSIVH